MPEPLPKRILVVDDDAEVRDVIGHLVSSSGYRPIEAAAGQVALDILQGTSVDLIILDIMMPEMDGFTVLKKIRESGSTVPVVVLTARSLDEDLMEGYSSGADFYLVKPVSMPTLRKVIDYLIGELTPEERAALEKEI